MPTSVKYGAIVRYCGHDASFVADVYQVGSARVVRACGRIDDFSLTRPAREDCTHHVSDHLGGFWRPDLGVLVVPAEACPTLRPVLQHANLVHPKVKDAARPLRLRQQGGRGTRGGKGRS